MSKARGFLCAAIISGATADAGSHQPLQTAPAAGAIGQVAAAAVDPALEDAVRRFYAAQEAEDADAYLALWSATLRPPRDQLAFVFASGDDRFSDITITRLVFAAAEARVRVAGTRERTTSRAGNVATTRGEFIASLAYVKEGEGWRLVREGPAVDDLATSLLEAPSAAARDDLMRADAALVNAALFEALSRRGSALAQERQFAAAEAAFARAVEVSRTIDDRRREGEALQNLANALYFQRQHGRALEAYQQRLAIERGRQDDQAVASALLGIATIHYSTAEYGMALARYREALAIQEQRTDHSATATTLISTGNVQYLLGEYPAAILDYRRSRDLARTASDRVVEADALSGLGRTLVAQGNFAAALDAFAGVLAEGRERRSEPAQGAALMNIGDVHFRLGNLAVARTTLEESRAHFEAAKDAGSVGRVWQALGLVDLVSGSFVLSEREYTRSAEACGAAGDAECVAGAAAGLGLALTVQDKFVEGAAAYTRAVEGFTALKMVEPAARAEIGLSQALTGVGRYEEALAAATRARHAAAYPALNDVAWRALVAEARAHRKAGALDRALGAARAAIYPVDEMRELASTRPGSPLPRDSAAAFATLAVLLAESGDPAAAFDTSERMRVHDLRATLAPHEREIARGMTPQERDEERAAAVASISLGAQVLREKALPRPDAARLADLERRLDDAVATRAAQQARLFERLPALRSWRGLVAPARSADLAAVLDRGTLLIDVVLDDERLLVMAAWREDDEVRIESKVSAIARRALAEQVAVLTQPAALKDAALWFKAAAPLALALPDGVAARARRAQRVLVVPHDVTWRVPFDALLAGSATAGLDSALSYASSISASLSVPPATPAAPESLVTLAAPVLSPLLLAHLGQTAPGWVIRDPGPAEREVRVAAGDPPAAGSVALTGAGATSAAFREHTSRAGVLHLAAPFRVTGASALFSPILLAPPLPVAGAAAADATALSAEILDLRAVMSLELQARAVVLSDGAALSMRDAAAESGLLHWAWRAAGVPAVIVSRWPTDDTAREALLGELHAHLRQGHTAEAALLAARRAVRRTSAWTAPFYWASWMVVGGK